jgi:hypothetical protein
MKECNRKSLCQTVNLSEKGSVSLTVCCQSNRKQVVLKVSEDLLFCIPNNLNSQFPLISEESTKLIEVFAGMTVNFPLVRCAVIRNLAATRIGWYLSSIRSAFKTKVIICHTSKTPLSVWSKKSIQNASTGKYQSYIHERR